MNDAAWNSLEADLRVYVGNTAARNLIEWHRPAFERAISDDLSGVHLPDHKPGPDCWCKPPLFYVHRNEVPA